MKSAILTCLILNSLNVMKIINSVHLIYMYNTVLAVVEAFY